MHDKSFTNFFYKMSSFKTCDYEFTSVCVFIFRIYHNYRKSSYHKAVVGRNHRNAVSELFALK